MMPGTVCSTTHGSRAVGTFCSSSSVTFVDSVVFLVSMTGVSAVTCTCSCTPATVILAESCTAPPATTSTALFRYSPKPCSDAFTW